MSDNLFIKATRQKLTFPTSVGPACVEQLWDLPLSSDRPNKPNLNDTARALHSQLKEEGEIDFVGVGKPNPKADKLQLGLDVVKYVIEVKKAEAAAEAQASANRRKRQEILELMEKKKSQEMEGLSMEDLQKQLDLYPVSV
jgi:hypothetical protein